MKLTVNIFRLIRNFILDLLFRPACLSCQKIGEVICSECQAKIPLAERKTESGIYAIYDYRDPLIKKMIWNLKYYHHYFIAETLGQSLYQKFQPEIANWQSQASQPLLLVIPVPISTKKSRSRGYNQALKIAEAFVYQGNKNGLIFQLGKDYVAKQKNTIPQAQIHDRAKRLQNILGVFRLKKIVSGRTIIVIDDVTTTGGTIKEIMKILKKGGAQKVIGLAVAH